MPRTLITGAAQSVTEKANQRAEASKSKQPRGRTAEKTKVFSSSTTRSGSKKTTSSKAPSHQGNL